MVISDAENDQYNVEVETDWSDHVLAMGQRYQIKDFNFNSTHLSRLTSGVLRMLESLLLNTINES